MVGLLEVFVGWWSDEEMKKDRTVKRDGENMKQRCFWRELAPSGSWLLERGGELR